MIEEKCKDLLDPYNGIKLIAHQTNTIGRMGAGLARIIKDNYLTNAEYQKYVALCGKQVTKRALLGHVQLLTAKDGRLIANCFAETVPTGRKRDTDYAAFEACMAQLKAIALSENISNIGIPGLMGCGLAGGNWLEILKILHRVFDDCPVTLTICYLRQQDFEKYRGL